MAELLSTLEPDRVKGIVCMMPAWQSATGQWTSREIREVWRCRSAAGYSVVLADTAGEKFACGMVPDHHAPIEEELLLRISPTKKRLPRVRLASRRTRRVSTQKGDA